MTGSKAWGRANADEELVLRWLRANCNEAVTYEPCGQHGPDFSVGNAVGVEVRRIHHHTGKGAQRKEFREAHEVRHAIENCLRALACGLSAQRWWLFVSIEGRRPTPKRIKQKLPAWLSSVLGGLVPDGREHSIDGLRICACEGRHSALSAFAIGMWTDFEEGGFVVGGLAESVRWAIECKASRLSPAWERFPHKELHLVDHFACVLEPEEWAQVDRAVASTAPWDAVWIHDRAGRGARKVEEVSAEPSNQK